MFSKVWRFENGTGSIVEGVLPRKVRPGEEDFGCLGYDVRLRKDGVFVPVDCQDLRLSKSFQKLMLL